MTARWIERHAEHTPDPPALRFGAARISYAMLARHIAATAALLARHGIGHGDRVAFLGHNHPSQLVLLFACARLGAMQAPLNWRLAEPELAYILQDSEAVAVFASPELHPVAQRAAPPDCEVLEAEAAWPGLASPEAANTPAACIHPEDPVLLVYTSG